MDGLPWWITCRIGSISGPFRCIIYGSYLTWAGIIVSFIFLWTYKKGHIAKVNFWEILNYICQIIVTDVTVIIKILLTVWLTKNNLLYLSIAAGQTESLTSAWLVAQSFCLKAGAFVLVHCSFHICFSALAGYFEPFFSSFQILIYVHVRLKNSREYIFEWIDLLLFKVLF